MSNRQVQSYLNRIKNDDPNKSFFLETIIPSLKGIKSRQAGGITYECPVCVKKLSTNSSVEAKSNFATYYTYTRHLSEQHKENLPCNGLIFSCNSVQSNRQEKLFKCYVCNLDFNRKEHLNKHKLSIRHQETKKKQTNDKQTSANLNKENCSDIILVSDNDIDLDDQRDYIIQRAKRSRSESSVSDCEEKNTAKKSKPDNVSTTCLIEIENKLESETLNTHTDILNIAVKNKKIRQNAISKQGTQNNDSSTTKENKYSQESNKSAEHKDLKEVFEADFEIIHFSKTDNQSEKSDKKEDEEEGDDYDDEDKQLLMLFDIYNL